jgi:ribosomal-protein-alanine N-acetyltransferase
MAEPTRIGLLAETDRLLLRYVTPGDAAFILKLLNEPSFIENIGDKRVRTLEEASQYLIDGPLKSYARYGHGLYLVELRHSIQPIGMCGLLKRDRFRDVDLGYAFLPEFWSRGYAYEAASAVLTFGRSSLGLSRILALVSPGNAASIKMLRKLGFAFAGFAKLEANAPDVCLYEITA